ncbi:hypothetical protein [Deefgea rivuli]|uniref:hypothetical protein n=1 Tax=Deefgea rivuli TaxID=400948 RepID=UPI000482A88F|nr:hypothetical protein [Deefgea rivuli]
MTNVTIKIQPPMMGAWALVTGECQEESDGPMVDYEAVKYNSLKVLSETHFTFITHAGDAFSCCAGGVYSVEADRYVEQIQTTSSLHLLGREFAFQFCIEGDLWHNTRWENGVQVEHEIWRRLDSK